MGYNENTGYYIYCGACRRDLSESATYAFGCEAILAWVHGPAALPPMCPFCSMPPMISDAHTTYPIVSCQGLCPLRKQKFTLEEWNLCRPKAWEFERLAKRWGKKPDFSKALQALKLAISHHCRGRYL